MQIEKHGDHHVRVQTALLGLGLTFFAMAVLIPDPIMPVEIYGESVRFAAELWAVLTIAASLAAICGQRWAKSLPRAGAVLRLLGAGLHTAILSSLLIGGLHSPAGAPFVIWLGWVIYLEAAFIAWAVHDLWEAVGARNGRVTH